MKKIQFFVATMATAMLALGSQAEMKAQADANKLALKIWVVDAVGNSDTVFIYVADGATDGLDAEFGEVNLYGVPVPDGKGLDLRIVQRTDTNFVANAVSQPSWHPSYYGAYWLSGVYDIAPHGWLWPYSESVDMKKNYISTVSNYLPITHTDMHCALRIHATNYPITGFAAVNMNVFELSIHNSFVVTAHNSSNGVLTSKILDYDFVDNDFIINEFQIWDNNANDIILLALSGMLIGIQDSIEHKILYPNPANDFVVLDDATRGTYSIVDSMGAVLKTFYIETTPFQLNIRELTTGNYFIVDEARSVIYKFIKE